MLGLSTSGPSTLVAVQESQVSKYVSQEPQPGAEPLHQFAWPILESIRPQNSAETADNV